MRPTRGPGAYVDDTTLTWVKQRLREGRSLREIAPRTSYFARDLDEALWSRIGGRSERWDPMF